MEDNANADVDFMVGFVRSIDASFRELIQSTIDLIVNTKDPVEQQTLIDRMRLKHDILNHDNHRKARLELYDNGNKGCYIVNDNGRDVHYSGITRLISKAFFNYNEDDDKNEDFEETIEEPYDKNEAIESPLSEEQPQGSFLCKSYGRCHGTIVHQEMDKFTKLLHAENNPNGMCNFFRSVSGNPHDSVYADGCTLHLLRFLAITKLIPVGSEVIIFDTKLQMATQVDLICMNARTFELAFIEIKTGYGGAEEFITTNNNVFMRGPLRSLPDTPCMRANVQLALTIIMLCQRYNVEPPHNAYVLHVCKNHDGKNQIVCAHSFPEEMCGGDNITLKDADMFREAMYLHVAKKRTKEMARNMYSQRVGRTSSTILRATNVFKKKTKKGVFKKSKK